jgi:HPt (histidine-containing phosphotransfer) domain-containing protein
LLGVLCKWIRPAAANAGASPSNDEGDLDALKALPGIDTSTWTRSRMGDAALYRRLLRMFLREQATFPEPFLAALADGDRTTMRRLAHNARSLSATLGAHGVARAARALEEGCVDADSTQGLQALLDELAAHLRPVLDGLRDAGL